MTTTTDLKGRRILVVEDEFLIASNVVETIEDCGAVAIGPCPDVDTARRMLAEDGQGVDAAILDLNLKRGGSAMELAQELAAAGTVLVYHTGYSTSASQEGLPDGVVATKPVTGDRLMQHVANCR